LTATLVALEEIRAAAERIRGIAARTPLIDVGLDRPVALKCENFQPMGAFKIRGAFNMLARLAAEAPPSGVITYSSGNHGQAVALAAQTLGIPAVVVMPEAAPAVKVQGVRRYGAEVIFAGTTSFDRKARAEDEAAARRLTVVPPFDHPWIVAGAGTCGLEILEQHPAVSTVYVPIGGGGLISGVAAALKSARRNIRVIGVEPADAARMRASRSAGAPVTLDRTSSIADGLLVLRPGDLTFAHVQAFVDEIVTVTDAEIIDAVHWLFREARLVAEPSGAASVAAALRAGGSRAPGTVAVVSGGNVSAEDFAGYIHAQLTR
jgi:threonine dehydratase